MGSLPPDKRAHGAGPRPLFLLPARFKAFHVFLDAVLHVLGEDTATAVHLRMKDPARVGLANRHIMLCARGHERVERSEGEALASGVEASLRKDALDARRLVVGEPCLHGGFATTRCCVILKELARRHEGARVEERGRAPLALGRRAAPRRSAHLGQPRATAGADGAVAVGLTLRDEAAAVTARCELCTRVQRRRTIRALAIIVVRRRIALRQHALGPCDVAELPHDLLAPVREREGAYGQRGSEWKEHLGNKATVSMEKGLGAAVLGAQSLWLSVSLCVLLSRK